MFYSFMPTICYAADAGNRREEITVEQDVRLAKEEMRYLVDRGILTPQESGLVLPVLLGAVVKDDLDLRKSFGELV